MAGVRALQEDMVHRIFFLQTSEVVVWSWRPCLCLLSKVHSRYLRASHTKILHLGAAKELHSGLCVLNSSLPWQISR
jgi:hypothetical protein